MRRLPQLVLALWSGAMAYAIVAGGWGIQQRLFSIDDAYIFLTIARNIATGHGSSFDGLTPTNGYQPLWMAVIASTFRVAGPVTTDSGLRWAAGVGAVCVIAGAILWLRLLSRMGAATVVMLVGLLALLWEVGFGLFGMEVPLNVLMAACFFLLCWDRWSDVTRRARLSAPGAIALGLAGALLVLTRLDLACDVAIVLVALAGARVVAGWPRREAARISAIEQAAAALPVVAYLSWNRVAFGHWMPISAALRTWHYSYFSVTWLRSLPLRDVIHFAILMAAVVLGAAVSLRAMRRGGWRAVAGTPAGWGAVLSLCVAAHVIALLFLFHRAFEPRYLVIPGLASVLIAVVALADDAFIGRRTGARLAAAGAVVLAAQLLVVGGHIFGPNPAPIDQQQGFRAAAAPYLTRDAIAFQVDASGILGWFCACHVINGDGVANNWAYLQAVDERRVAEYLDRMHVNYVLSSAGGMRDGRWWIHGLDLDRPVEFPILSYPLEDALVQDGWQALFHYPGRAVREERPAR